MELMSSLLLCAIVAFSPPALGVPNVRFAEIGSAGGNNSLIYAQGPRRKTLNTLLAINKPSLEIKTSDLFYVFMDETCKQCTDCMDRAIKSYKTREQIMNYKASAENFREEMLSNYNEVEVRDKRQAETTGDFKPEDNASNLKKIKSKKNKGNKLVTVTKYNRDGEITALKVKETSPTVADQQNDIVTPTACQVYSIKKSYSCDTPESDLILAAAKRKIKKSKKDKNKVIASTEQPKQVSPTYRKREVDNSQVPENFMTSIEEYY